MQEKEVFFTDKFYPKAKNIETKRFIYAIEQLIKEGKIKSFKAIAEKAGFSSQDFTDIKTGRKTLQTDFLDKISKITFINKQWVLFGEGDIYVHTEEKEEKKKNESEIVKELIFAIKRRDEQVDALIKVNEKHADNLAELIKQMKKTDVPKVDGAGCVDASGF